MSSQKKPQPPSDLWERIEAARKEVVLIQPVRPEGCFTAREYAASSDIDISTARRRLDELVDAGKLQRVPLRVRDDEGILRKTTGYVFPVQCL